ncbi:MAG TPA: substrate-binding domain-containing protein [Vicinamibacterales bacterium]
MRLVGVVLAALLATGCGGSQPEGQAADRTTVGLVFDTLREERWERDRDLFVARAHELGVEVAVRSADGDAERQHALAGELLATGVDALVIVPTDLDRAGAIVRDAAARGVPVVSYDRLIRNADVALYVSFDNVKVGRLQAEALLEVRPSGRYVLLGGSPTDHNARLVRDGQLAVLQPAIDAGRIRIVADRWVPGWDPERAAQAVSEVLRQTRDIQAIVASNDSTASGAVEALTKARLAGRVAVSGQDADLAACQRIIEGTQTMTVYKPLRPLARMAAGAAVSLARGETVDSLVKVNNGLKDVPARLLDPIAVDRTNIDVTVIADGYHSREAVYAVAR